MSNEANDLSRILAETSITRDILGASIWPMSDRLSAIDSIINAHAALQADAIATSYGRQLNQVAESMKAITKSANVVHERYLKSLAESVAIFDEAISPNLQAFQRSNSTIEQTLQVVEGDFPAIAEIGENIRKSIGNLNTANMLPELPRASMFGFGRLTELSNTIHTPTPYATTVSQAVAGEIGAGIYVETADLLTDPLERDSAAVQAGLQAELIAFPPSEYSQVIYEAKFQLAIPRDDDISAANQKNDPYSAASTNRYALFVKVENHLRNIIEDCLQRIEECRWIRRRVPENIRKRWQERIEKERARGRTIHRPIDYADFADLMHIICRGDNWRDVFQAIFGDKSEIQVSFGRLIPVRNAIAHSRPLGKSDTLFLISESTRILTALGLLTLH